MSGGCFHIYLLLILGFLFLLVFVVVIILNLNLERNNQATEPQIAVHMNSLARNPLK